ncbi:MAG TPA: SusE domain-containing protein [Chryseosolibacter sp.]|nr:SusE domain-containing protein [Chryseosolibacter sp.]
MKKSILLFTVVLLISFACDEEKNHTISDNPTPASVLSHADGSLIIIDVESLSENITFEWAAADYGIQTVVDYEVQIDLGGNAFADPVVLGETSETSLTIGLETLNDKLLEDLALTPNVPSSVELRVISTVEGAHQAISPVVTLSITAYTEALPEPLKLWIPGGYQASGGDPSKSDALTIYAVPGTEDKGFEGYVTIPAPTWIKFTSAPDWSHLNYGSAGSESLTTDGSAPGIDVPAAGYYKIVVNTGNMTYLMVKIDSWGLIGTATPGSWNESTAMEYDAATQTWKKTMALANGALKFRANNNWDVNYGPADSNAYNGTLIQTEAAISVAGAGTYTVTIDLTRSRSPYAYTYTVVRN